MFVIRYSLQLTLTFANRPYIILAENCLVLPEAKTPQTSTDGDRYGRARRAISLLKFETKPLRYREGFFSD